MTVTLLCGRLKESRPERVILFGEESLRTAIHDFVGHYHAERNHQGLRQRLGDMLNYYYRAA